jgi:tetrahydromethanopterin S-methyltransferase subunit F
MRDRFRELLPGDVEETLEFFREEALQLARVLRSERPVHVTPATIESVERRTREFFARVRSKDDVLGVARGTRILRHGAVVVSALDNIGGDAPLEASISWLDRVVENIEQELDVIDRKRILWLTVGSAAMAALAVVVGITAIVISLFVRS